VFAVAAEWHGMALVLLNTTAVQDAGILFLARVCSVWWCGNDLFDKRDTGLIIQYSTTVHQCSPVYCCFVGVSCCSGGVSNVDDMRRSWLCDGYSAAQ
jgi:hypothetical protein